jgi:hypothetical protein
MCSKNYLKEEVIMATLKLGQLLDSVPTFNKLTRLDLDGKVAFKLFEFLEEAGTHLNAFNKQREQLIIKYKLRELNEALAAAQKVIDDDITKTPEEKLKAKQSVDRTAVNAAMDGFNKEQQSIAESDITITLPEIKKDDFKDVKLSISDIQNIKFLLV